MSRRAGLRRIKVFWPNVGSITDYPKSTGQILSHIDQLKPLRREAVLWICNTYGVVYEFARKLLNVLDAAGVLRCEDSRYELTVAGRQFLESGDSDVLFRLFFRAVSGFKELLQILEAEAPLALKALDERWVKRMRPLMVHRVESL